MSKDFYPCTCEIEKGFEESCFCLPENEKNKEWSNQWYFHQEKYCDNIFHSQLKQNGYIRSDNYKVCNVKQSERLISTENVQNFPCPDFRWDYCHCIYENEKSLKAQSEFPFYLLHKHNQYKTCNNQTHSSWFQKQHYQVKERPAWPHTCELPLGGSYTTEIRKLCKVFGLSCTCNRSICLFCFKMGHNNFLLFPSEKGMSLSLLKKLFPFIKFDSILLKKDSVKLKPLFNQDGSRIKRF